MPMTRTIQIGAAILVMMAGLAACSERASEPTSPAAAEADIAAIRAVLEHIEHTFQSGDLDAAMTVFTDDAVIMGQGAPDVVGTEAIRTMYAGMMNQFDIAADLSSDEIEVSGDHAYERGTYTLILTDKASGQIALDVENRYIHIFERQPDGAWKTWRMMVNSAEPAPATP